MDYKFLGKYFLSGDLHCLTGLHIGGTSIGVEIGGLDNPVLKDPLTEFPYIPGSSLKGKMRSLMEWSFGLIDKHPKHKSYSAYSCEQELKHSLQEFQDQQRWHAAFVVARLFGPASDDPDVRAKAGPSRLIVRDAFPTQETQDKWIEMLGDGIFTEIKTENALDRVTSEANPRPIERVPAGSIFGIEMIVDIFHKEDIVLLKHLIQAMRLLEHSTLGGSGSRGHGQIKFENLNIVWRPVSYYVTGNGQQPIKLPGDKLESIVKEFDTIQWP